MGVVVLADNCPTNEDSCPIGVIVLRGRFPKGYLSLGVLVIRGSCPREVVVLWGSFPQENCPQGSCARF